MHHYVYSITIKSTLPQHPRNETTDKDSKGQKQPTARDYETRTTKPHKPHSKYNCKTTSNRQTANQRANQQTTNNNKTHLQPEHHFGFGKRRAHISLERDEHTLKQAFHRRNHPISVFPAFVSLHSVCLLSLLPFSLLSLILPVCQSSVRRCSRNSRNRNSVFVFVFSAVLDLSARVARLLPLIRSILCFPSCLMMVVHRGCQRVPSTAKLQTKTRK